MEHVNNVHDCRWVDEDTTGAKGYALRNLGDTEMLVLTVYDPPRERA